MKPTEQLFGQGVRRSKDKDTRRYNLFAARLIADLIKNSLGPCGMEKMFIDVLGEVTVPRTAPHYYANWISNILQLKF
jgi:chaperonin GroEL (HSP60 family)